MRYGSRHLAHAPAVPCPVAGTLDLVGDRWTLLVLRDLFFGKQRFDTMRKSDEGIATNVLSDRLAKLEAEGFISHAADPTDGRRVIYSLNARGRSLEPGLRAIMTWGLANIAGHQAARRAHPARESRVARSGEHSVQSWNGEL